MEDPARIVRFAYNCFDCNAAITRDIVAQGAGWNTTGLLLDIPDNVFLCETCSQPTKVTDLIHAGLMTEQPTWKSNMTVTNYGDIDIYAPTTGFAASAIRGSQLQETLQYMQPGRSMGIHPGRFDFGSAQNVVLPLGNYFGMGMNSTYLYCGFADNIFPGCAFECQGNGTTILEDLTLISSCQPSAQSEVIGFGGTDSTPYVPAGQGVNSIKNNGILILNRCRIISKGFGIYNWSGTNNSIFCKDCEIVGGRWGVYNGASMSATACLTEITDSKITMDASYCTHVGKQGPNLVAFAAGGGVMNVRNCYVSLKGNASSGKPHGETGNPVSGQAVNCAWINADGGQPGTRINLLDVHSRITPNGAPSWADISLEYGVIAVHGGSGSGPLGQWINYEL